MPSADMDTTSAQPDRSLATCCTAGGISPRLFTATSSTNITRKNGNKGGRLADAADVPDAPCGAAAEAVAGAADDPVDPVDPVALAALADPVVTGSGICGCCNGRAPGGCAMPASAATVRRKTSDSVSTTGTSMATRNILARVAAFAMSGERMLPAPTTWATSWMEPPRKSPASGTVMPNQRTHSGYSTITAVERLAMPMALISVQRSLSGLCGSVDEMAMVAEMPQMPVPPPDSSPNMGDTRSTRAISTPKHSVNTTAPASPRMPQRPSADTSDTTMRTPSSATPTRTSFLALNSMPGRQRSFSDRK